MTDPQAVAAPRTPDLIDDALQYGIAFLNDPEGLASAREEWRDKLRVALHAYRAEAPAPSEPLRAALDWALDNLDAEDEVIGDAMSWAVTAHGKTVTMARSTEYEAGKQKARAILAALPPSDPPALDDDDLIEKAHDSRYSDEWIGNAFRARLSAQPEAQPDEDADAE